MSMGSPSRWYIEGHNAARQGALIFDCPYEHRSEPYLEWRDGYLAGLRSLSALR